MKTKIKRPGSGRTKGSFSFVSLTLAQLNSTLTDPNTPVIVSRKFAEGAGFKNLTAKSASDTLGAVVGTNPASAVAVKVSDFNAPSTSTTSTTKS